MTIRVEVVWSPGPRQVERRAVALHAGACVGDALHACGIAPPPAGCGVWGRRAALSQPLREGDRVEVLRPLVVDPKEARRLRHQGQRPRKTKRPAGAGR